MKKMDNKGFMLAETLIVTIFVLGIFVMIYRNSLPIVSEYAKLSNYDDLNSVYAVYMIKQLVNKDDNYHTFINELNTNDYKDISNCSNFSNIDLCNTLKNDLGIDSGSRIIITKWDPSFITSKINNKNYLAEEGNRGIKDYISYIVSSYNKEEVFDYRIIISRNDNGYVKYANLGGMINDEA